MEKFNADRIYIYYGAIDKFFHRIQIYLGNVLGVAERLVKDFTMYFGS